MAKVINLIKLAFNLDFLFILYLDKIVKIEFQSIMYILILHDDCSLLSNQKHQLIFGVGRIKVRSKNQLVFGFLDLSLQV